MKIGSIASNPNKLRLMEVLQKGETTKEGIAKKIRLPLNTLEGILTELIDDGLVSTISNNYRLTEEGEKTLKSMKEDVRGKRK
ncbi:MAG: winged helix-turn-helix domain-containing protein [Archaeoglobaceae archaeon]